MSGLDTLKYFKENIHAVSVIYIAILDWASKEVCGRAGDDDEAECGEQSRLRPALLDTVAS